MPITSPSCYLCLTLAISQRFLWLPPWVPLICWVTELRKLVYSLHHQFITKVIRAYESRARWRDPWGEVLNKGASVLELGVLHSGHKSFLVHQLGNSQYPVLWFFKEALLCSHDWWNQGHWPPFNPQPHLAPQRSGRQNWKFTGRFMWQPAPSLKCDQKSPY